MAPSRPEQTGATCTTTELKPHGFKVAENPVHVHDLQATLMHLLGFDPERLTYRFQGRDYRLTDVHEHVVKDVRPIVAITAPRDEHRTLTARQA
jgi:arylsulfatase A-like enzyme